MDSQPGVSYDVRLQALRRHERAKGASYEARWVVAKRPRSKSFATRALGESFRSELRAALNRGEPFDVASGLPVSMLPTARSITWWEWSLEYVDLKWPTLAPKSRRSLAEGLTTATMALTDRGATAPTSKRQREAMLQWAYNTPRRRAGVPPEALAPAIGWLSRHSPPVADLEDAKKMREVIQALGRRLDGTEASATTAARKCAVFHNALEIAVERGHFTNNPMNKIKRARPKVATRMDPRLVVNPAQARALLDAVAATEQGRRLVAFYGCLYYAALRPSEALDLAENDLALSDIAEGWGEIHVGSSNPEVARAWSDDGHRTGRRLKHRAQGEIRVVPAAPPLVKLLTQHLTDGSIPPGGRLFRGPRGGHLSEDTYGTIWQQARREALSARETASPLARRPYDLRHAAVSTWIAAGVDSTQVAAWAGHSVAVLHRVYAHVLTGRNDQARRLIERLLSTDAGASAAP